MNPVSNPAQPEHDEIQTRQNPVPSRFAEMLNPAYCLPPRYCRETEVATAVSVVLPFSSYPQSRAQWEVCAFGGHRSHQ